MLIVHMGKSGLPNMECIMHKSGLNYYEPPKQDLLFLNTVSKNKEVFSKIKIKISIKSWGLQYTLIFYNVK